MIDKPNNLLDVESMVDDFIIKNELGINTIFNFFFKNNTASINSLKLELKEELINGCVTFINKNYDSEDLNSYLFYIVNSFCKNNSKDLIKKKTEYICPGCLYIGQSNIIEFNKIFYCSVCENNLKTEEDPKKNVLYKTFYQHHKKGFKCNECKRFIPKPLNGVKDIICPYLDCCFVGNIDSMESKNHPSIKSKVENISLDTTNKKVSLINKIHSSELSSLDKIEIKESINNEISTLKDIISSQKNSIEYVSSNFTVKHKFLVYESIEYFLNECPVEMSSYLLRNSRTGGFQHKIFQKYISLLENEMPFSIKKNNKIYKIDSLLDDNLNLFDGISEFSAVIDQNGIINNNTKEYYIGGRKGFYSKPFYLGKILSVLDEESKTSLNNEIIEYSFSKIKMNKKLCGKKVLVTHLRVVPHYQMGGMVYVNRIRKKIVDKAKVLIN